MATTHKWIKLLVQLSFIAFTIAGLLLNFDSCSFKKEVYLYYILILKTKNILSSTETTEK